MQYRTEENRYHPNKPTTSVFETLNPHEQLAICVTMAPAVERLAHGPARQDCPLGSFPSNGITSATFDSFDEQFYAADSAGLTEHVQFAGAPEGSPRAASAAL